MAEINIPQIGASNPAPEDFQHDEEGSILIPKIDLDKKKKRRIARYISIFLLAFFLFVIIYAFLGYRFYVKVLALKTSLDTLVAAANSQDLPKVRENLKSSQSSVTDLKNAYKPFVWLKVMPFVGVYVKDIQHFLNAGGYGLEAGGFVVETVEPYADIIGFAGGSDGSESGDQTTQERLDFVIKTIPDLIPKADALIEKITLIRSEVDAVNPELYPEDIFDEPVRDKLKTVIELIDNTADLVENGKPLLESAPYLLGVDGTRQYLVIFQNDKELRPTGGFITAYSIAKVDKGRFEPVSSADIYSLDDKYTPKIPAPEPLIKYIKGPYTLSKNFRLRDMNWSPDFAESMDTFSKEIKTVGIQNIDGIIAVDTQVLVNILNAIGPVQVSGFGEYSTKIVPECDCPQVIYELESFADIEGPVVWSQDEPGKIIFAPPNYDNRKKIIGPLMNSVLANALGQPKEKLPVLFEAVLKSLTEKHVLFYINDEEAQKAVELFGIGGVIDDYNGDYLHINDANLGGRKSNLYVTQEVNQSIEIAKDGVVTKTVTITYKNPKSHDGWLNSVLPNWVRIYVPEGSELIDFSGVEEKEKPYNELGKTVFAGLFNLRPQGVAKVSVQYKLPFKVESGYNLFIQKQPGTDAPLYTIDLGKKNEEFFLKKDMEVKFKI